MRLRQISGDIAGVEQDNPIRNVILNELEAACPLLEIAEFYQHAGSADTPLKPATAVGGAVRAINSEYTGVVTAPVYGATALKIFGDKIKTDIAYQRRGYDIGSEHLRQIVNFAKSLGRHLQNAFVNSTIDATNINGMKALVDAGMLVTFDSAGDGTIPVGNTSAIKLQQEKFLEVLDNLISSVQGGAQFLLMDAKTKSRLKRIAMGFVTTAVAQNAIGQIQEINSYNGVPIVLSGYTYNQAGLVIPHTETVSSPSRSACTSIYAGRFGEKDDLTLATNVGVQVINTHKSDVHLEHMIDLDLDMALLNVKALTRLQGIVVA